MAGIYQKTATQLRIVKSQIIYRQNIQTRIRYVVNEFYYCTENIKNTHNIG
jgi:hypothetical protein